MFRNPLKQLRDLKTILKALNQWAKLRKEIDSMDTKSLFTSKTFWINILMLVLTLAEVMPLKYAATVTAIANVILRMLTDTAITVPGTTLNKPDPQE